MSAIFIQSKKHPKTFPTPITGPSLKSSSKYSCFDFAIVRKSDALPDRKGLRPTSRSTAFSFSRFFHGRPLLSLPSLSELNTRSIAHVPSSLLFDNRQPLGSCHFKIFLSIDNLHSYSLF